jgi:hypothetical protein
MTVADLVWWWLLVLVAASVVVPFRPRRSTLNDPVTAIIGSIVDAVSSVGAGIGGAVGLGDAAAAALPAAEASIALPEVTATALAPAAAGIGGDVAGGLAAAGVGAAGADAALGGLAPAVAGAGAGATDLFGGGTGALAPAGAGGSGFVPTATPGSTALTSVAPIGTGTTPAAAPPPPDFAAASPVDPAAGGAGGAAGTTGPLSGPVSGGFTDTAQYGPGLTSSSFDPATGVGTAGGVGNPASGGGILDKILPAGASSFLNDNKGLLTLGAAGIPLISSLIMGNPPLPGQAAAAGTSAALTQSGNNLNAEGLSLTGNAMSGVLPPGFEAAIEQAKNAATTKVANTYGGLNLSGSTSEAVDKANVGASVDAQRATILNDLLTKGVNASTAGTTALGQAGSQDLQLARLQLTQDEELQKALQALASNLVLASIPARTTTTTTTGA